MRPYRGCRSGRTVRAREATKVFNIQPAMTPRCHQFSFYSGRNDNDLVRIPLISNRPCCSPPLRFGVWNARSLKTKVSSLRDLMLSCSLDLLSVTESWLTSNDSITIADLTNSLEDYAFHHLPSSTRRGGGLAVIARKGLHVSRNEGCIFSSFEHFDSTITSGNKVFRLLKVHLPPPSKKNGFTVERFFSEFSALSEELTVTFCQFLLCGDFNFHVDIDSNANAKQFSDLFLRLICHPLCELIGNTPWNWSQSCEKAVCAVKCALTSAAAVLAYFDPQFPVELWVDASPYGLGAVIILVYLNGNRRLIAYASQTLKEHDKAFSYNIRFVPSKRNTVADVLSRLPLPSTFNEEDAIYRVEERLVHLLPITNKEISYATRVDTVLSRT